MFTGLVQHCGRIASIQTNPFGAKLAVDASDWAHQPAVGDSIAVNGCCLTVAAGSVRNLLNFDVIQQTLRSTAMGTLKAGERVNLEHAVTPQTMLGGHIVQGHIDGIGTITAIRKTTAEHRLRVTPTDSALMQAVVEKGSIAVSGVSLTVASTGIEWFEVALIPTTLALTNLGDLCEGDHVNLETDYLAKVVINYLRRTSHSGDEHARTK